MMVLYVLCKSSIFFVDHKQVSNRVLPDKTADDETAFVECNSRYKTIYKAWKQEIERKRDEVRSRIITGEDESSEENDEAGIEVVTIVNPTTPINIQEDVVSSVTAIKMMSLTMQLDVANQFTLNDQQKFAFMFITGHLDGDTRFRIGKSC